MKAAIGRIVHYVAGGQHLPAIIMSLVTDTCVNLQVFNEANRQDQPHGGPVRWSGAVNFDGTSSPANSTWHWPEREGCDNPDHHEKPRHGPMADFWIKELERARRRRSKTLSLIAGLDNPEKRHEWQQMASDLFYIETVIEGRLEMVRRS